MRLLPRRLIETYHAHPRRAIAMLVAAGAAALIGITLAATPADAGDEGQVLGAERADAVAGQYIVVFRDKAMDRGATGTMASRLASRHSGRIGHVYYSALRGFSVTLSATQARRLAADPDVDYVEQDATVSIDGTQAPTPSYGLDRLDQRALPLNNSYTFPGTASTVHAYIVDTGIRLSHHDFGGRASSGFDAVDGGSADDCNGHGTHVAGTVGGSSFGVAKGAALVAVRVLNCQGSGTNSQVIAGVDWVTRNAIKPAVANMSLGGGANTALDNAVTNFIASGVSYSIAAGNSNADACGSSPARVAAAITVGATTQTDARASFSNVGTCLDVFAPGQSITSAWFSSDTATNTISGTSMASPHSAGAAALILAANPSFTPAQVRDKLVADATPNVVTGAGPGSPNRLLFVSNSATPPPPSTTVFSDTFETATGWTTNAAGTDTATTGAWQRGAPAGTTSGGVTLQRSDSVSGSGALVTGAAAGASAGEFDVDGGTTSALSPAVALPSGTLTLSFSWYLAHLDNATGADFFRVSVVAGSSSTVVFSQAGAASNRAGAWTAATVTLSSFAGQTIRLRVEAADAATASLIEAALDDVLITRS
jgi:subtilisin family serine protease